MNFAKIIYFNHNWLRLLFFFHARFFSVTFPLVLGGTRIAERHFGDLAKEELTYKHILFGSSGICLWSLPSSLCKLIDSHLV